MVEGDGNVRLQTHRRVSRICSLLVSVEVAAKTSINKKSIETARIKKEKLASVCPAFRVDVWWLLVVNNCG